ncbi:hypothetical protein Agub_g13279, partial [Astrephomene gubernaculifera]
TGARNSCTFLLYFSPSCYNYNCHIAHSLVPYTTMAKSGRSNSQKKLRTQRREQLQKQTTWLATAEEKRQAALAACLAAPAPERPASEATETDTAMETADKPVIRVKKLKKTLKGAVMKKGGKKKVTVLAGKNQFYKKGKKGTR